MQVTLKAPVGFSGTGLHSGRPVRMTLRPASAEYGIWFRRTDVAGRDGLIPARWDAVVEARLCTRIANAAGVEVSTVEHLMAALAGCGVHNALIEIDGPEVPILDGSAAPFVRAILARGLVRLEAPVRALRVLEPVEVRDGEAWARLAPAETLEIDFAIDFADAAIGRQRKALSLANGAFVRELADSRTFCRKADVDAMRASGLALGGSYENAVVVDGAEVLTPGGLRHGDEPVRHKMLDALGDLALAGAPILGRYTGHRAGHAMTNRLLRALFARPQAFRMTVCDAEVERRLPGAGVGRDDLLAVA
ncbi:MAG: UDP-3-O-acyl-N-acetylglucosamine deacetylase [Rhodobacteraceae bacterium]|nr:UDP-3-O-acyl-N-acetylglucosamine deacetylase [Paracoccaceae bacterium]